MTDSQENKLSMYQATDAVMDANSTIWTPVTAVSDIATKAKAIIVEIQQLRQVQELDTKGITVNKTTVRAELTEATLMLINGLAAFASYNENYQLLGEVNYTPSELKQARDTIFYDKAALIQDKAKALETELADFLVTSEDITGHAALLEQYATAIPEKRAAVSVSKTSTHDLKLKFKEMDTLLKEKLDKLILIFEPAHPDFVMQYFTARIIIDLGHQSAGPKTLISGTVTDFQSDAPINGAYVWIVETGQSFTTETDGHFSIELANAGEYTVKVEKDGYRIYTEDAVQVNQGQEVTLEIELEPEA